MKGFSKEEIGILIAVRMKSSRLKSKAMGEIVGKPVISHLIERMKRVKNAGKIVLCTSTHPQDSVLLDVGRKEGIEVFAGSELDVMKRFIDAAEEFNLKTVVRVTGDNPLTDPQNIDRMIEEHLRGDYDFTKSEFLPLGVNAEIISIGTLKRAYETAEDTSLTEYMTTYLKRPDIFRIQNIESSDPFFQGRSLYRLTVDYEEDLKVMNEIYGALYERNPNFSIRDVLEFLDRHPDVLKINANVVQIPLPKIFYKGEKKHDKKLVLICQEMDSSAKQVLEAIRKTDEYDIVGFFHDKADIQFSLVENVPVLGRCTDIDKLNFEAGYYCSVLPEGPLRSKLENVLLRKGLKMIDLQAIGVPDQHA